MYHRLNNLLQALLHTFIFNSSKVHPLIPSQFPIYLDFIRSFIVISVVWSRLALAAFGVLWFLGWGNSNQSWDKRMRDNRICIKMIFWLYSAFCLRFLLRMINCSIKSEMEFWFGFVCMFWESKGWCLEFENWNERTEGILPKLIFWQ